MNSIPNIPAFNPESEETRVSTELEREHLRPLPEWKCKQLWPYTPGTRMIWNQVTDDDTLEYWALAFIFIHLRRSELTCKADMARHVIPLAWKINNFRAEVMEFREGIEKEDVDLAITIMEEAFAAAKRTEIQAGPIGGKPALPETQKKTEHIPENSPGKTTS